LRAAVWFALGAALVGATPAAALDAPNGRKLFKQLCAVCHVIRDDGRSSFGPNLAGVIGRPAGTVEGYPYSGALRASGLVWTAATLDAWIAGPNELVPGTAMKFPGLDDHDERAALIGYLVRASE
jgi:cytochrome c